MSKIKLKKYGSSSKAIIAFPGWTHPLENEKLFLQLLSEEYCVYSANLPGYMGNSDLASFLDFEEMIDNLHQEMEKIPEKEVILMGFSMGCRLIVELEKKYPSSHKKVFVGCPVEDFVLPFWMKFFVNYRSVINFVRKFSFFKSMIVDMAMREVSKNKNVSFREERVTLTGAFDSLMGLFRSKSEMGKYANTAKFIYGENDRFLVDARKYGLKKLSVIAGAGHNCVAGREREVMFSFI